MLEQVFNKGSHNYKNISILILGNGIVMLIPLFISPILSRIYTVEDFGILTLYISAISLVSTISSGRFDHAILIAKTEKNATLLRKIAVVVTLVVCLLLSIIIVLFSDHILIKFNAESLGKAIYLIPFNILLFSIINIYTNTLNREKEYGFISTSKIIRTFSAGSTQLLIGFISNLGLGLVIGKLAGDILSFSYLRLKVSKIKNKFEIYKSFKRVKYLLYKYKDFPKVNSFHAFINELSKSSVPLILGFYFGERIVGYYGLSFMVCVVPVIIFASAFNQVFSKDFSEKFNNGKSFYEYAKKMLFRIIIFSIIPFGFLMLLGPELFGFIFGEEWIIAGKFVQLLSPYLMIVFIITPFNYIPMIYGEQKKSFIIELVLSISRILALIIGANISDAYMAIFLFSLTSLIVQSLNLLWIFGLCKRGVVTINR